MDIISQYKKAIMTGEASKLHKAIVFFLDYPTLLLLCVLFVTITLTNARLFTVVGTSMYPTLQSAQHVLGRVYLTNDMAERDLDYGDIVIVEQRGAVQRIGFFSTKVEDDKFLIKRVIGMPGDYINITKDGVYRNDVLIDEPYLVDGISSYDSTAHYLSCHLSEGEYYVVGDNRENSLDSRFIGPLYVSHFLSKVMIKDDGISITTMAIASTGGLLVIFVLWNFLYKKLVVHYYLKNLKIGTVRPVILETK